MKITHIGPDTQFVQFISGVFESVVPGANEYIILTDPGRASLRFPIRHGRVREVASIKRGAAKILLGARGSDMVIAHMMTPHAAIAFMAAPRAAIKVWGGWGADYYGSDESPDTGLLGPSTLALSESLANERSTQNRILAARRRLKHDVFRRLIHRAAAMADYFSAPIQDDFAVFKRRFPEFHGGYSQIDYGSTDDYGWDEESESGENILVGNSATLTNNHLEIFEQLASLDTSGRKIVVPLGYGNPEYRDEILTRGSKLFGSSFMPLVDFLPLEEYLSIVASCNIVIMNHKRQQGMGNTEAALYQGAHVFLDEASPLLNFFRSRGAFIHTTGELEVDGLPREPLSAQTVAINRRVLEAIWGPEQVLKNVEALISRFDS
jgi:dTDP-N-acetylfucosamine:lipid II N-acetylfucosaminyltransferase